MLSTYLASHFLSPNGYLAYACNFDSLVSDAQREEMRKMKRTL